MATSYKVLGQVLASAGGAYSTLYNTPSSTSAVVSTLIITNQSSTSQTYNVAVASSTTSPTAPDASFILYSVPIPAYSSTSYTLGLTLETAKYIRVAASSASVSFAAFGSEITA